MISSSRKHSQHSLHSLHMQSCELSVSFLCKDCSSAVLTAKTLTELREDSVSDSLLSHLRGSRRRVDRFAKAFSFATLHVLFDDDEDRLDSSRKSCENKQETEGDEEQFTSTTHRKQTDKRRHETSTSPAFETGRAKSVKRVGSVQTLTGRSTDRRAGRCCCCTGSSCSCRRCTGRRRCRRCRTCTTDVFDKTRLGERCLNRPFVRRQTACHPQDYLSLTSFVSKSSLVGERVRLAEATS